MKIDIDKVRQILRDKNQSGLRSLWQLEKRMNEPKDPVDKREPKGDKKRHFLP